MLRNLDDSSIQYEAMLGARHHSRGLEICQPYPNSQSGKDSQFAFHLPHILCGQTDGTCCPDPSPPLLEDHHLLPDTMFSFRPHSASSDIMLLVYSNTRCSTIFVAKAFDNVQHTAIGSPGFESGEEDVYICEGFPYQPPSATLHRRREPLHNQPRQPWNTSRLRYFPSSSMSTSQTPG